MALGVMGMAQGEVPGSGLGPGFAQRGDYGRVDVTQGGTRMAQSGVLGFTWDSRVSPNGAIMARCIWSTVEGVWPRVGYRVSGWGTRFRVGCRVSPIGAIMAG